ncbi:hypothetical protein CBR_g3508 [Chara braunii]|uniref:Peroxisomal membrane protein PEX14 n=1 Tax=Chara braunii TaxID=69332 RepID=A0A388KFR7_CHABU|nr:hypothetical protein CBR_g3508 [Chara braunii]|eukprot:GBG68813.1 hypothetical protein CBR_g3508 [Chara braunii]
MEGGSEAPARGSSSTAVLASEMAEETNDNAKGEENENGGGGVEEVEPETDLKSLQPPLMREDQVQNAVNFLSHPKVRGSPVKFRRAFLERKGLSQGEIDEAFRRVPDSSPSMEAKGNDASGLSSKAGGESVQSESVGGGQTSAPTAWKRPSSQSRAQTGQQPTSVPRQSTSGSLSRHVDGRQQNAVTQLLEDPGSARFLQKYPPLSQSLLVPPRRGFRWTQMVLALGVLAAAGAGTAVVARNYFLPRLKSWIRHIASNDSDNDGESDQNRQKTKKPSVIEEAATAAAAAASAVTVMAKEMATSRTEEQKHRDALLRAIELQREDLSAAMTSLKDMVKTYNSVQASAAEQTSGVDGSLTVKDLRKELLTFASVMRDVTPGQSQDVLRPDGQGTRSPPVYAGGNRGPRPDSPAGSSVRQDVIRGDRQGSLSPPLYSVRQESPSDSPVRQASSSVGGKVEWVSV